jgi:hypothetical protein
MLVALAGEAIPTASFNQLLLYDKDAIGCTLHLAEAGVSTCINEAVAIFKATWIAIP